MIKFRRSFQVVFLVLVTGCTSVETTTFPTLTNPPTALAATPTPTMSPTIPRTAIPVTPTSTSSPTSTPSQPVDYRYGLIAFSSDQDGDFEIWVMDADGSAQRRLTDNEVMDISPAWSPDGTQIAFISNRDGNDEIYVMNADGSDVKRLTQTTDASESFPAWSPDGLQISFDSNRDGNWDIYVMTSGGSDPRRLTDHPSEDWISSWSPDRNQIVFESKRNGNYDIFLMDSEGNDQRQLTEDPSHDGFPAWSPDSTQIAFMSQRDGNFEIYLMDSDGTNQRRVTDNPAEDSDPAWSPDGEWLAFVSQLSGNDEIYVIKADGSNFHQLTDNGAQNWSPAWQPAQGMINRPNTWIRKFEGPEYGAFLDIALTPDGNILAVGSTNHLHVPPYSGDALFMKLTLAGDVLWEQTWGGDGYEQALSVVPAGACTEQGDCEGGYYIFGETDSYGAGDRDFFLQKTFDDGTEGWFQTYGRSHREWPYGMLQLSNGELLLYGFTESNGGMRNQYAIRVAPDGEVIWEYVGGDTDEEFILDALETPQGDLVLVVGVEEDGKLVKLDANGNLLWAQRYELPGWQFASQIAQIGACTEQGECDRRFLLAGFSMSSDAPRQVDTWLAGCSPTGELEWETSFGEPAFDDYATSMIRLNDGTFLIGAIANGMLLSRIDAEGNVLWRRSLLGQAVHGGMALAELEEGGYLVAGLIQLINGRSYDAILLRTDSEGRLEE